MFNDLTTKLADILHHPGRIFPAVVAIVLIATAAIVILHLFMALLGGHAAKQRRRFNLWEKLVYLAHLVLRRAALGRDAWLVVVRPHVRRRCDDGHAALAGLDLVRRPLLLRGHAPAGQ